MPDAALRELVERRLEAETTAADTWAPRIGEAHVEAHEPMSDVEWRLLDA
jgi:hypothetical protein